MKRFFITCLILSTVLLTYTVDAQDYGLLRKPTNVTLPEKIQRPLGDPIPAGTYSIGTGGYFPTIDSAFNKLSIDGVAGSVTLELIDELYVAPATQFGFTLNGPIPGAGPNSRVIIKPAENKNVTIQHNGRFTLYLANTSYVTFDGVDIEGPTTLTIHTLKNSAYIYNDGIVFMNNSDHNVIQNVIIINDDNTRQSGTGFDCFLSNVSPDSNIIQNNFVKKAGLSFYIINTSLTVRASGNIIRGNKIGSETDSLIANGFYLSRCENTLIENNIIQNLKTQLLDAHREQVGIMAGATNNTIIRNNVVRNFRASMGFTGTGILVHTTTSIGENNLVYNNMIYDIQSSSTENDSRVAGIQLENQNNPKIYYNSVYLTGKGENKLGSAALYIHPSVTNADVKNNILVNTRDESPYCASAIYDYGSTNLISDFNDLYYDNTNANNCLVRIGSTNYHTLADWQATGKDIHSISEMPNFKAPYLHIVENEPTLLESRGIPIAGIDKDFDGQTRHATNPDIGADEFNGIVVGVEEEEILPIEFALLQNYPNPFNPSTVISFQLPVSGDVLLKIYDILGNEIATLVDEYKPVGNFEVEFDASRLASGIYFYQLKVGEFIQTRKMLLIK